MGASLSQIIRYYGEAQRLGNPKDPVYFAPEMQELDPTHHGLSSIRDRIGPYTYDVHYGCSVIGYQIDFTRFDTGHLFIVRFKRNDYERSCLENQILNDREATLDVTDFHEGLPDILRYHLSAYITTVNFRTEGGIRIFEPLGSLSIDDLPFNTVPKVLDRIPRVAISKLRAPREFFSPYQSLVVVSYNGDLYIFKNHTIFPLPEESITWDDELLHELLHLSKFQSQFILQAAYVVTGMGKSSSKFRGYLHPYCPAGSLEDIIIRLEKTKRDPAPGPKTQTSTGSFTLSLWSKYMPATVSVPPGSLLISWPVKVQWAIDITSGLVTLHKAEAYVGVLGLQNLLLGRDGHIKMIDTSPFTGYHLYSAAPEVNDGKNPALTGPRDIFSLGLIFWQLAEELVYTDRETTRQIPRPFWRNGQNSAPDWFRVLVQSCLSVDPTQRPSANVVLSTLIAQTRTYAHL